MILGFSSADDGMMVGLWKLSSLDSWPPWYRPLMAGPIQLGFSTVCQQLSTLIYHDLYSLALIFQKSSGFYVKSTMPINIHEQTRLPFTLKKNSKISCNIPMCTENGRSKTILKVNLQHVLPLLHPRRYLHRTFLSPGLFVGGVGELVFFLGGRCYTMFKAMKPHLYKLQSCKDINQFHGCIVFCHTCKQKDPHLKI